MAHLKTTWHHVRRSPYQALAAIMIMTVTFFVVSAFTFLIFGSSKIISYFETRPQVIAFFKDNATQQEIDGLRKQLAESGKVASMKYVSKQGALAIYKEQNKSDPLLLDLVTADILPASLEISTFKIEDLPVISNSLRSNSIVSAVSFEKDVVKSLETWTNALRKLGLGLVVVLSIVSIFIMATIVSIKISQKREEIEIMRLIGATKWYISWPFVLEGIFYGVMGALFGWILATGTLLYAQPYLSSFLKNIPVLPVQTFFLVQLLGIEFLLALLLGTIASWLAVIRYLK